MRDLCFKINFLYFVRPAFIYYEVKMRDSKIEEETVFLLTLCTRSFLYQSKYTLLFPFLTGISVSSRFMPISLEEKSTQLPFSHFPSNENNGNLPNLSSSCIYFAIFGAS